MCRNSNVMQRRYPISDVAVLSLQNGIWDRHMLPRLPYGLYRHSSCTIGCKIFLVGGLKDFLKPNKRTILVLDMEKFQN